MYLVFQAGYSISPGHILRPRRLLDFVASEVSQPDKSPGLIEDRCPAFVLRCLPTNRAMQKNGEVGK